MLLHCPKCATSYDIDGVSLGAGRAVRCVRCQSVWFATNAAAIAEIARSHRADIAALAGTSSAAAAEPSVLPTLTPPAPVMEVEPTDDAAAGPDLAGAGDPIPAPEEATEPAPVDATTQDQVQEADPPATFEPAEPADPIAVADAPSIVPAEDAAAKGAADAAKDIETFAARRLPRRAARRRAQARRSRLLMLILALVAVNLGLISWRTEVVRYAPQTAALYEAIGLPVNLRGLEFKDIAIATETHDGVRVLVVDGTVVNVTSRPAEVPRLRFAVRNKQGHEIYTWTALPSRSILASRDTLAFRSRLASPPRDGHDMLVRFYSRHDRVAGGPNVPMDASAGGDEKR